MKLKATGEFFNTEKIAKLANLTLSKEEINKFSAQFIDILNYLEKLRKLNTSNVEETSQVTGLENVTREDKVDSSRTLTQEEALSGAKPARNAKPRDAGGSKHNGFFKVKGIFNEE